MSLPYDSILYRDYASSTRLSSVSDRSLLQHLFLHLCLSFLQSEQFRLQSRRALHEHGKSAVKSTVDTQVTIPRAVVMAKM